MPTRRRIQFDNRASSGSGGGSPSTASLAWGPSFGQSAGNDDETFNINLGVDLDDISFTGDVALALGVDLDDISFEGNTAIALGADLDAVDFEGDQGVALALENPEWTVDTYYAYKDVWINNVALCPVDVNRDGQDLQIEGTVATRKDVYMAWDLSGLPSNATVTAARLIVYVKTTLGATGTNFQINRINDGEEGWDETTMRCSTAGTLTNLQTVTGLMTSTGEKTVTLNSSWRSRIASRMGTGDMSIVLTVGALATGTGVFESADEGTNNERGPRLEIEFSTPK